MRIFAKLIVETERGAAQVAGIFVKIFVNEKKASSSCRSVAREKEQTLHISRYSRGNLVTLELKEFR